MTPTHHLILACTALVVLTAVVAARMLAMRIREMKSKRISPQSIALSSDRSASLQDTRAADNFNNLFETPVLFYALCALAVGSGHTPWWLVVSAWGYVLLRTMHSYIQCGSNHVMRRFKVFVVSVALLLSSWLAFAVSFMMHAPH